MKKLALGIGILLLIVLVVPASAVNDGAEVIKDTLCHIIPQDYGDELILTSDTQKVINDNTWKITCRGQLDEGVLPPLEAVIYNEATNPEFQCSFQGHITQVWQKVITPTGQITLTCHGKIV